jgi:predicted nucleotidyltransferase component of viral defense system
MPERYYLETLYPFQEKILKAIEQLGLDFYLTGGTALGRCYLNHRYSDDLDFFVNRHPGFKKQSTSVIDELKKRWDCDVAATSETFVRVFVQHEGVALKVDFVNDVASHFGSIEPSSIFNRIDSCRNILSNKLCALSRLEGKDIADIVYIAKNYAFEWETVIAEAKEKDLWVDPLEICRIIDQFPTDALKTIKWIGNVSIADLTDQIQVLHNDIFTGAANSLAGDGRMCLR